MNTIANQTTNRLNVFTVYWLDGTRSVISGPTVEEAFTKHGYGGGAIHAVDFYANGDDDQYEFIKGKGWTRKTPVFNPGN